MAAPAAVAAARASAVRRTDAQAASHSVEHLGVGHHVVAVKSLFAALQQPCVGEHREVLGDVCLGATELLGEIADTPLAVGDQPQQPQPRGLGQEPKPLRQSVHSLWGGWPALAPV